MIENAIHIIPTGIKVWYKKISTYVHGVLVGIAGAVITSAGDAVQQYFNTCGGQIDFKQIKNAMIGGAVTGIIFFFFKSPRQK